MSESQKTSQPPVIGAIEFVLVKEVFLINEVFPPTPATAQRESVLLLDAIEQLISAAYLHYRRIQGAAQQLNALQDAAETEDTRMNTRANHVSIVADIGALIGTVHRLRSLVKRLPGDDCTRRAKRAFEAGTKEVQKPRHHLEHLDSAVKEISETGQGTFGAVSWWYRTGEKEVRMSAFVPGTIAVGKELISTRVPTPEQVTEEIGHVWASIAGSHFNVSAVFRSVTRLEGRLREWGAKQAKQGWPSLRP